MNRWVKPFSVLQAAVLAFCLTALAFPPKTLASQVVHGRTSDAIKGLTPVDRLDGASKLNLTIGLPLRNRGALTNLLRDLYDPASPRYHQYLTASQFADQFGPTKEDYEAVQRFAGAHGLTVTGTHPNRTLLDVRGSVADVEKALHVHLRVYQHPKEARRFFAPDAEPSLDLDVPLSSIGGLDNFTLPHPLYHKASDWDSDSGPDTEPAPLATGSGPIGYFIGGDFRAAYAPGVSLNGAGQSVGLFELDTYFPGDIADYEALAKLPNVPLTNVLVDGFNSQPGSGNVEVALDIDMAICMAPGLSQVMVYEGNDPNEDDILNRMATDNTAKQLSSSWSFPVDASTESIFQEFAAQGQSMFQASGDSGAYGGTNLILHPCDDPNVTVVGGTALTTTGPGGAWVSETTWNDGSGGVSTTYSIPSWQQSVSMAANHGSTAMRNLPDVACVAAIQMWIVADNGGQGGIGGTSAAAPLWAGFAALANQQAAANGRPSIGFINPAIYNLAQGNGYNSALHDITTGNNTNAGSPAKYFAVPGYDLCTGWGTPSGSGLINALALPPDPLQIIPNGTLTSTGRVGGPFNPLSDNLVLTNISSNWINFALGCNAAWVTTFPDNGTLTPFSPCIGVGLSLNPSANNLSPGSHVATIWFTNLNDGVVQSRTWTLDVVTAPVITQQPPLSEFAPLGGTATFTVGTASNALEYFQWQYDGTNLTDGGNISGSATSTLTISPVNTSNVGTYTVIVSNAAGVAVSGAAALNIFTSAPGILTQPASQTDPLGGAATFTVTADGDTPLSYQWQWNGTNLTNGGNVSGATSSVLTLNNLTPSNAGTYSVIVSNDLGSTPSANATLAIDAYTAPSVTLSSLYSFTGGTDGGDPNGLMQETNGIFYGTTAAGGAHGAGSIFAMTPSGAVAPLYSFNSASSGASTPAAGLTQGPDGNLYGTTELGGTRGVGTVFVTTTNGVVRQLATLRPALGSEPAAPLIVGRDGALYGTTVLGGAFNVGEIFRITTNGTLTGLASFNYTNGAQPTAVIQAADGSLWGTTYVGGASGDGTAFRATTNGALASVVSFSYTNGPGLPYAGLVQTPDGNFWGTTYEGGAYGNGLVYEMTPAGTVTTIYSFTGQSDGAHPAAALTLGNDGNFYGTTAFGGAFQAGTVFRLTPEGDLVSLAQFDGFDGAQPASTLVQGSDGNLYGTTVNGGADGAGAIFSVNINSPGLQISAQPADQNAFIGTTVVFSVSIIGNGPFTYQWKEDGTNLSDVSGIVGSTNRFLTLSNINYADSGVYSVLVSNASRSVLSEDAVLGVIASPPQITTQPASQTLTVGANAVFSVTAAGDLPLTYQWQENGTNLTDGGQISGSGTSVLTITNLFETNRGSYSVIVSNPLAATASAPAVLTVYAVSTNGTTMAAVHGFTGGTDGGVPNALFRSTNGLIYGTTQNGGLYGDGTVFSLAPDGTFSTLASFDGTNGAMPVAGLVQDAGGILYGTTKFGGSNSLGTIFSVTTNGVVNSIYSFNGSDNNVEPFTALALDAAGNFYGATSNNSAIFDGNLFKMTPGGTPSTFYTFPLTGGTEGVWPSGTLTLGTDGNLYGLTTNGGAFNYGSIFRITPAGALTTIYSFTGGADGYFPIGQLVEGTDGNFYGVTKRNTVNKLAFYGTIFKVTPAGAFTTIYSLDPGVVYTDGTYPFAGLLQGSDGNFYGTTVQGFYVDFDNTIYNNVDGTVFQITPSGTLTTLTALNGTDDGANPEAALVGGADGSLYGTTITNGPGGQGTIYRIAFTTAPHITSQPASQTNLLGGNASFSVTVFGAPQLFYQWQKNGTNLTDGANISGSTARVVKLRNLSPAQAGLYSVTVSNALGAVSSSSASLTLEGPLTLFPGPAKGGTFSFTWTATVGQGYQIQSTTNLLSGLWTNLGGIVTATNAVMSASDSISPSSQKFYRILLAP